MRRPTWIDFYFYFDEIKSRKDELMPIYICCVCHTLKLNKFIPFISLFIFKCKDKTFIHSNINWFFFLFFNNNVLLLWNQSYLQNNYQLLKYNAWEISSESNSFKWLFSWNAMHCVLFDMVAVLKKTSYFLSNVIHCEFKIQTLVNS